MIKAEHCRAARTVLEYWVLLFFNRIGVSSEQFYQKHHERLNSLGVPVNKIKTDFYNITKPLTHPESCPLLTWKTFETFKAIFKFEIINFSITIRMPNIETGELEELTISSKDQPISDENE
jgi:hypothetical protein